MSPSSPITFWAERSVPELPKALQGDRTRLALTRVTLPLLGKGFRTLLIQENKTSGKSSGTQQADKESSDRSSHVRVAVARAACTIYAPPRCGGSRVS